MGAGGSSGVAKMEHLAKTQFFACMDKADLKILCKQAKLKFYATGQQVRFTCKSSMSNEWGGEEDRHRQTAHFYR